MAASVINDRGFFFPLNRRFRPYIAQMIYLQGEPVAETRTAAIFIEELADHLTRDLIEKNGEELAEVKVTFTDVLFSSFRTCARRETRSSVDAKDTESALSGFHCWALTMIGLRDTTGPCRWFDRGREQKQLLMLIDCRR